MTQEEKGKTYALHKASKKLNDYYGSAMLNVVQFNGYDIQDAYIEGCNHINEDMIEALRTEYEKGRHDVIEKTLKWLWDLNQQHEIMSYTDSHVLDSEELQKYYKNNIEE